MHLTFKGGIHPLAKIHHGKYLTENCSVENMIAPKIVKIPMSQHIGAPAVPLVAKGDSVLVGQKIGEANGFVSVPCHSSVSGTVLGIENITGILGKQLQAVVIENDFQNKSADLKPLDYERMTPPEIVNAIKNAGIVGMGGATFPLHVKLMPPADKKIEYLILNGAECEPFLTADHRLMLEYSDMVIKGAEILKKALGVSNVYIGIEDNKKDAISIMQAASAEKGIDICVLQTKYPQGGEKQLVYAVTGREIPSGALPAEVGVVVTNVATAKAVADAFVCGQPLISRITTVTGSVKNPKNLYVPFGTPFSAILDESGGATGDIIELVSGGPMMGLSVPSLDCVVTKGTSGLLVLGKEFVRKKSVKTACIQCGRCMRACPMHLMPMRLAKASEKEMFDAAENLNVVDCINCGSCSYVCPAKRDLSQYIKIARDSVMVKLAEERKKKQDELNKSHSGKQD